MRTWMRSKVRLLFMTCAVLLAIPAIALASDVATSVVDTDTPFGSVTLTPGNEGTFTITATVTGRQGGESTFKVNRDWALSGGTFVGSNPETFTVPARASGSTPAQTFTTTGKVTVDSTQAAGTFNLKVPAFGITNTTTPNLAVGTASTYSVTVTNPPDPCAGVTSPEAPVITADPISPNGSNDWYKSVPTVSATSATSGATITYAAQELGGTKSAYSSTAPTIGQGTTEVFAKATSATCDRVSESTRTFMVDSNAPTVNPASVVNNTWRNTDLSQAFTASDGVSGLANATDASFTLTASDESANASTPTVVERTVSDVAGNSTTRSVSAKIDKTDPNVSLNGGPADGQSYFFGDTPAAPTCDASDALSDLNAAGCVVSGYSSAVGTHTVTASATDNAGNENSASSTYTVKPYTLNGFYQPIDMNETVNTVKNGSTVPVKFELFKGATELTSTSAVTSISARQVSCAAFNGDPTDEIEYLAPTGGTSLRYDATAGQFIYNWATPKKATTCYNLTMTAADGSPLTAYFKLR